LSYTRTRQVGVVRNPVDPDPPQAHPLSRDAGRAGDDDAFPGEIVLDPFCGTTTFADSALRCTYSGFRSN
jgi:hypothetical protein